MFQSTGSEVDRHILSMMTESSVDFTNKFAKLANAVVNVDVAESPTGAVEDTPTDDNGE